MTEDETMRKYAEAHGCRDSSKVIKLDDAETANAWRGLTDIIEPVRPLPCVRVGGKVIKNRTDKEHFAKIDEELNELKEAVILSSSEYDGNLESIAEEAADTITAITTMLEALGIDAEMRDEAQRRVNEKNRMRGRL